MLLFYYFLKVKDIMLHCICYNVKNKKTKLYIHENENTALFLKLYYNCFFVVCLRVNLNNKI